MHEIMAGHSKWANIKRRKWAQDAKKAAVFTKMARNITVAAREGGGDPDKNFRLALAIDQAKKVNMPKENIEKARKKGTGELKGERIEECLYEGIGPAQVQFIVKSYTDNRNRSAAEIKHLFHKHGGDFASVKWNFSEKGVIRVSKEEVEDKQLDSEDWELGLIDRGAEDIKMEEEGMTIHCAMGDLSSIKELLEENGVNIETADIEYIPHTAQKVEGEDREKVERFMEALEDCEEVNDYYNNCEF